MTKSEKAVMQQALYALLDYQFPADDDAESNGRQAISALKQAIAQLEQPAPQPSLVPLTDAQIDTVSQRHWAAVKDDAMTAHRAFANPIDSHRAFARTIEQAHSIKAIAQPVHQAEQELIDYGDARVQADRAARQAAQGQCGWMQNIDTAMQEPLFETLRGIMGTESIGQDIALLQTIRHYRAKAPQPTAHGKDAEIARLTACLKAANADTEKFEREWYLRGDELEAIRAQPVQPTEPIVWCHYIAGMIETYLQMSPKLENRESAIASIIERRLMHLSQPAHVPETDCGNIVQPVKPATCEDCGGDGIVLASQNQWACQTCSESPITIGAFFPQEVTV